MFPGLFFGKVPKRTKKDKKGRTSPDRETPPFETPLFSGPENPYRRPSKNPSKKHLLLKNLLRTLLRSVRLHDPLGVRPTERA